MEVPFAKQSFRKLHGIAPLCDERIRLVAAHPRRGTARRPCNRGHLFVLTGRRVNSQRCVARPCSRHLISYMWSRDSRFAREVSPTQIGGPGERAVDCGALSEAATVSGSSPGIGVPRGGPTQLSLRGPGVADTDRERIFEPFYRAAHRRARRWRDPVSGLRSSDELLGLQSARDNGKT